MLVLTRKAKQRIQIGDNISITVLRVKGQTVRIGIDAPSEIRVRRSELTPFDSADQPVVLTTIAGSGIAGSVTPDSVTQRREGYRSWNTSTMRQRVSPRQPHQHTC